MKLFFSILLFVASLESVSAQSDSVQWVYDSLALINVAPIGEEIQNNAKPDELEITPKTFSETAIQELKEDGDLNYKLPPTVAESLWDRIKQFLLDLFISLFSNAVGTNWGRLILYVAGIVLLVVLIMTLLKVNAFRVLYGRAGSKLKHQILDEDIQEMDFESLLEQAILKHDYRRGVRLLFLYALKILSDKQLIHLDSGKTNHDYVDELKDRELKTGFKELSFYFDYAWYGNFSISADTFLKAQGTFHLWKNKVR